MSTAGNPGYLNMDDINAALHLAGRTLDGGWTVGARNRSTGDAGLFSVTYPVEHTSGRRGFLKVLDLVSVFGDLEELSATLSDFLVERDLLLLCGAASMSRVVMAIDHGRLTLERYMPPLNTVHYIIFEHADRGDLNDALTSAALEDTATRLELIHDYAVGLRQLHSHDIAHQDIKPRNSLVFAGRTPGARMVGKVSDLGRAYQGDVVTSHDQALIPGDRSFAPPEQLYGYQHPDVATRRFGGDLYQLGSLICYTFSGITMNAMLAERLAPEHHWESFGDGYRDVLPYLQDAYAASVAELRETLPPSVASEIANLVEYLCEPEVERRGHPRARGRGGSPLALQRIVAELNLAATRARTRAGLGR